VPHEDGRKRLNLDVLINDMLLMCTTVQDAEYLSLYEYITSLLTRKPLVKDLSKVRDFNPHTVHTLLDMIFY
jgi:hypothetical protein